MFLGCGCFSLCRDGEGNIGKDLNGGDFLIVVPAEASLVEAGEVLEVRTLECESIVAGVYTRLLLWCRHEWWSVFRHGQDA